MTRGSTYESSNDWLEALYATEYMVELDRFLRYVFNLSAFLCLSDSRIKTVLPEFFAAEPASEDRTELAIVAISSIADEGDSLVIGLDFNRN